MPGEGKGNRDVASSAILATVKGVPAGACRGFSGSERTGYV